MEVSLPLLIPHIGTCRRVFISMACLDKHVGMVNKGRERKKERVFFRIYVRQDLQSDKSSSRHHFITCSL